MIYKFYWNNEESSYLIEINEKPYKVKKLLNEYRKADEDNYNIDDWALFLIKKGYKVKIIEAEARFWF